MEYRLVRSERKTLSLCVERDGSLTVRAPLCLPESEIARFLAQHTLWIERRRARMLSAESERVRPVIGGTVMFWGEPYRIDWGEQSGFDGNVIRIQCGAQVSAELAQLFSKEAKARLVPLVWSIAQLEEIPVASVRITGAQTRYGSCSSKNGICLSWRIVTAPQPLIESVILHELCHVLHHNHGKDFWAEVYARMPDYDEKKRALDIWARRWFFKECEKETS